MGGTSSSIRSDITKTDKVYKIVYSRPGVVIIFNNKEGIHGSL
jgi:hypothetical protein